MTQASGRNAAAIGLIAMGVIFLIGQVTGFSFWGSLWPFFIVLPGLAFLYVAINGDRKTAGLAVPGAMVTGTGLIFVYQNFTGHWESWAYAWALYPLFLGLALVFIGRRTDNESTERTGDAFVKWGLFACIGLWAMFELFIFGSNNALISMLMPLALIGAGIYLLTRGRGQTKFKTVYKAKNTNGRETLQDKIDAALAEDDDNVII